MTTRYGRQRRAGTVVKSGIPVIGIGLVVLVTQLSIYGLLTLVVAGSLGAAGVGWLAHSLTGSLLGSVVLYGLGLVAPTLFLYDYTVEAMAVFGVLIASLVLSLYLAAVYESEDVFMAPIIAIVVGTLVGVTVWL